MGNRDALGAADVTDAQLTGMVAALLHEEDVELIDVSVEEVDYDLPAITTGGRWWVSGHATTPCSRAPFRFFVKQVQSWERSPFFASVPEEYRELAVSLVPWRTEAQVYRSDLAGRLPRGLSIPRALGVYDLDATSSSIWLEEVPARPTTWDGRRYERAAYLLGRLSGSRELAPLAGLRDIDWSLNSYATGRLAVQVVPILMSDEVWQHPLCAPFHDLKDRMRAAAADCHALAAAGDALPYVLSHGDACPNNLLTGEADDFVMIDFGFWGGAPVGFDLSQLLVGDVQIGKRGAENVADLDELIVESYVAGLEAEGCDVPQEQVWRSHALCLLIMTGLSSLPFDMFEGPVDDRTMEIAANRARLARHALDLVERTAGQSS